MDKRKNEFPLYNMHNVMCWCFTRKDHEDILPIDETPACGLVMSGNNVYNM